MNTIPEILDYLKTHSSEKYKANVTKLGIPKENSLGVSIGILRKLAKDITFSNDLSKQLWATGYHEARLLSVLIVDIYTVNPTWAKSLINDVVSWDLCDHLCNNLLYKLPEYKDLIITWQNDERLYHKRAAFSLIATDVVHDKTMTNLQVSAYLDIIKNHESDSRPHVRKAVSWALREIGKKDLESHQKAKQLAWKFIQNTDKNIQWIGKDALKEFENLVAIKGFKRLVPKNGKRAKMDEMNKSKGNS